jgi:hypothetical protein
MFDGFRVAQSVMNYNCARRDVFSAELLGEFAELHASIRPSVIVCPQRVVVENTVRLLRGEHDGYAALNQLVADVMKVIHVPVPALLAAGVDDGVQLVQRNIVARSRSRERDDGSVGLIQGVTLTGNLSDEAGDEPSCLRLSDATEVIHDGLGVVQHQRQPLVVTSSRPGTGEVVLRGGKVSTHNRFSLKG